MVRDLRNKFVIVTTALMATIFGAFLIVYTIYTNYWNDIEIAEMLQWIARSGIFVKDDPDYYRDDLVLGITDDDTPIIGIIMDDDGNIISQRIVGDKNEVSISETTLRKMYANKGNRHKEDNYYYSRSVLKDGRVLLVVTEARTSEQLLTMLPGIIALAFVGMIILVISSFFLSRFVTKPAENTLMREKRFISDASHELKTPLGAISINAQALETDFPNNLYLKNIVSESDRMSRLIERLLVLAKLDEQEKMSAADVSLSDICEETALTYESLAYERKIKYIYDIEPDIIIRGNEDELRQLFAILIDNALKNTYELGEIMIICGRQRNHSRIEISNTGDGIPSSDIPHIFNRFYTSDTPAKNNSFGLGLSIAKSIVERHGGTIDVSSEPYKTTTFTVTL